MALHPCPEVYDSRHPLDGYPVIIRGCDLWREVGGGILDDLVFYSILSIAILS